VCSFLRFSTSFVLALTVLSLVAREGPAADDSAGRRYALVIGVNKYDDVNAILRSENLKFAERDADQIADGLRRCGFDADSVIVMTTAVARTDDRFPTAANIRKQVKAIAKQLRDGDSLVVSFAGYEMQFAGNDDYYFAAADAEADDLHTLVSLKEVCARLDRGKGKGKLVIVDSCRAMEGAGPEKAATLRIPAGSVGVLFACSAGQSANETDETEHGVLSYFVVKFLREAASKDQVGPITAAELVSYIKERVPKDQKDQQPELIGPMPQLTFVP
jgi:uncharacterized caspase-like protein